MQLNLPFLTCYTGPRLLSAESVSQCKTYRDAVRMCWDKRTRTRMTRAQLAEETGCYASHITDYLSENTDKRELPAKHTAAFEVSCGNRAITQWLTKQADLTILETYTQELMKAAA